MHPRLKDVGRLLDHFHARVATGFVPEGLPPELLEDQAFRELLVEQVALCGCPQDQAERVAERVLDEVPLLRQALQEDIDSALRNDPAAQSREEVEACYPGFRAVVAYRLAHRLRQLGVPMLPRMLSEKAHSQTGIDINPGAQIGRRFFIDHGTGVVIGETTVIGDDVTLYQGVTIGARNLPRDPDGQVSRGRKRHPTVGNNVVIYANATLLGGDTNIGDDCVIGAGVWLARSVQTGTTVLQEAPRVLHRTRAHIDLPPPKPPQ